VEEPASPKFAEPSRGSGPEEVAGGFALKTRTKVNAPVRQFFGWWKLRGKLVKVNEKRDAFEVLLKNPSQGQTTAVAIRHGHFGNKAVKIHNLSVSRGL
jgi:hypothetical protein